MSDINSLIRESFEIMMNDVHVCLPAEIVKYDVDTMTCSVQPLIQRKFYKREGSEKYPVINTVPIIFPRTDAALIRMPVVEGDIVILIFADHEISNWINGEGSSQAYIDNRQHHINDCFALVGGYPKGKPHKAVNPDALEIIVKEGTKITIGNETDELLSIAHAAFTELKTLTQKLSETLTNIQAITVTGNLGAPTSVPINAAAFATTKTAVDSVTTAVDAEISKLENLKV